MSSTQRIADDFLAIAKHLKELEEAEAAMLSKPLPADDLPDDPTIGQAHQCSTGKRFTWTGKEWAEINDLMFGYVDYGKRDRVYVYRIKTP